MSAKSEIEWTDTTWNPTTGCTPVSEGCRNCYAAKEAIRLAGNPHPAVRATYAGLARMTPPGPNRRAVFTGRVNLLPDRLDEPLRWRKPRRVFVNSMSDLFHEDVPIEFILRVFEVMAACPQHTFQILTKRPERMAYCLAYPEDGLRCESPEHHRLLCTMPLPNVWLGTSVEDQAAADERIPHLLRTPAAVRFLSCEPLLGSVDLTRIGVYRGHDLSALEEIVGWIERPRVDWVIVGGESGPGARRCDLSWIRRIVADCRDVRVPVFVKQLGAVPYSSDTRDWIGRRLRAEFGVLRGLKLSDRKGGSMGEWPEDLRVREFPEVSHAHVP